VKGRTFESWGGGTIQTLYEKRGGTSCHHNEGRTTEKQWNRKGGEDAGQVHEKKTSKGEDVLTRNVFRISWIFARIREGKRERRKSFQTGGQKGKEILAPPSAAHHSKKRTVRISKRGRAPSPRDCQGKPWRSRQITLKTRMLNSRDRGMGVRYPTPGGGRR